MFFLIGIIISSFLTALLLLKRNKSHADLILTAWMALTTVHQALAYLHATGMMKEYPHLLGAIMPWPLQHGHFPALLADSNDSGKIAEMDGEILPHFIPFVILYLLAIPFYLLSAAEKTEVFNTKGADLRYGTI